MFAFRIISLATWSQVALGIRVTRTRDTCPKPVTCEGAGMLFGIGSNKNKVITQDPFGYVYHGRMMQEQQAVQAAAGELFEAVLQPTRTLEFRGKIVSRSSQWKSDIIRKDKMQGSVEDVRRVYAGPNFMYVQLMNGSWLSAGANNRGQLGFGSSSTVELTPRLVKGLAGLDIKQVSIGYEFAVFVLTNGSALAVGSNQYGQLGSEDLADKFDFVRLPIDSVASASAGFDTLFLVDTEGFVFAAGSNDGGQLCMKWDENDEEGRTEHPVFQRIGVEGIVTVAAGLGETLLLAGSGDVHWCGSKDGYVDKNVQKIKAVSNVKHIAISRSFQILVLCDGSVMIKGGSLGKKLKERGGSGDHGRWRVVPELGDVMCSVTGPLSEQAYFLVG